MERPEAVVEGGCEVGKTVRVAELTLYSNFSPHITSFQSYSGEFLFDPHELASERGLHKAEFLGFVLAHSILISADEGIP
jgi:hypothetical protein